LTTDVVPILRVADAGVATRWYARLGFQVEFEHRFEPHLPAYVGIRRDGAQLHLSEHAGDARPGTLVYVWVDAIDPIASEFGVTVDDAPWGREIYLFDPDHNRLRVAEPERRAGADHQLGAGTVEGLTALEHAMWGSATRGDRAWMDAHLADDFTEFGYSGRSYTRADILGLPVGTIDATLEDIEIRAVGRDAALVTYRSVEPRGTANRSSLWRRVAGEWRLAFHQGTPAGLSATRTAGIDR
jgi:hypothetical protein